MIQENDLIALLTDLSTINLIRGDVGTIAHVYQSGTRYEVEFVNAKGDTIAVETLTADQIRKVNESRTILHYMDVERAA